MDASPDCSLVIPIHEPRFPLLPGLLSSIDEQSTDADVEVIVVNDGGDSTKLDSLVDVADYDTEINIERLGTNEGAGSARNKGLELASGEIVLFVDSDCKITENFIQSHYELNTQSDAPGVVGGSQFVNQDTTTAEVLEEVGYWSLPFRLPETRIPASWGPTLNLSIKADRLEQTRFDATFPSRGGGEDVDFCWQITNKEGEQPFLKSDAPTVKHPSWGIKSGLTRFFRWGRAEAMLMEKYPERRQFTGVPIPLLLGGSIILGLGMLLAGGSLPIVLTVLFAICCLQVAEFAGKMNQDLTAPALRDPRFSNYEIPTQLYPILYGFEITWQFGVLYHQITTGQIRNCVYRINYFPEVES